MFRRHAAAGLRSFVIAMVLASCRPDSPPPAATQERVVAAPSSPAPANTPAPLVSASAIPSSSSASSAPSASAAPPAPAPVSCKTEDDCWFDDAHKPIARPAKLRGKKITPCKAGGGTHSPACVDSVCVVRAWKC